MDFDLDYRMVIDGRLIAGEKSLDVVNPATAETFASVPDATSDELNSAVVAARRAFPAWSATSLDERREVLRRIAARVSENVEAFMRLLTREQGKPHGDARGEVMAAAAWCSAVAQQDIPVTINEETEERRSETRHVPLGVVGCIVPWNFPLMLAVWKFAPALLTGNTVVMKPSPFTPLTMAKLGELVKDLVPPGVLNVVIGGDALGPLMTEHPGIDKISFTGSSATGRRVMASAACNLKRVTLELGGNDAAIVLPDVDVKKVAEELFWAAFYNSGQVCIAAKRMYIHEDIYDELSQALADYARTVTVGNGAEQGVRLGPIQNRLQFERVRQLIAEARLEGLNFIMEGEIPDGPGYFIPVTLIDNPPEDSRVVTEEAFGPVLPLLRFREDDDVIARANNTDYGLAGSIWTNDTERAARIAARLETGTVWVNEVRYITPTISFGGHKQSGLGVEGGIDGLLEYTNAQTISIRKPQTALAA